MGTESTRLLNKSGCSVPRSGGTWPKEHLEVRELRGRGLPNFPKVGAPEQHSHLGPVEEPLVGRQVAGTREQVLAVRAAWAPGVVPYEELPWCQKSSSRPGPCGLSRTSGFLGFRSFTDERKVGSASSSSRMRQIASWPFEYVTFPKLSSDA